MDIITEIVIILVIWIILVYYISRKKSRVIKPYGPAIMISTERGREGIKKISKFKFWDSYGKISIYITLIAMVFTFLLLVWEAIIVIGLPKSSAPNPLAVVGLPGINPYIPIWYGIIGLIIAVVFHELSHGIQSAKNKIEIKSLGILWFIIPVGAFVEPDEEQIEKSEKKVRMKIFAAGPSTNLIMALVMLIIFLLLMSNVSVAQPGVVVLKSYNPSFQNGDLITSIDGIKIENLTSIDNIKLNPGMNVTVTILRDSNIINVHTISGVWITEVLKGSPAFTSGIKPGFVLLKIDNVTIDNMTFFDNFMENTTANQIVNISFYYAGSIIYKNIVLADKYTFYQSYAPGYNSPSFKGKGFLGVTASYMNISASQPDDVLSIIANPFSYGISQGFLYIISLPFLGLSPFPSYFASIYSTPFSAVIFWPIENIIYWIFWLNLMLGLTNVLPLIPLDGGYVFKDYVSNILSKRIKNAENLAYALAIAFSLTVVFLILWQFIYLDFL